MNHQLQFILFLVFSLLSTTSLAFEDLDADPFAKDYFSDEVPIVITASRLRQPITEAPTAMTIIDRQMIERTGIRQIPDLFRIVPGMSVSYYDGAWPVVNYHGMSDQFSRRMQILIDGRAVYLPDVGGPDWSSLPVVLDDIERIEITRGSNAATYGSNSFMGVINIITRHSSETVSSYIRHDTGENDLNNTIARFGNSIGDLDFRFTVKDSRENYYDRPEDFHKSQGINLRADYQVSPQNLFMFQSGYTDNIRYDEEERLLFPINSTRQFHQLQWAKNYSVDNEIKVQAYYSKKRSHSRYRALVIGTDELWIDNPINNERYDLDAQYTFSPLKSLRGVIGASTRKDKLWSPLAFNTHNTFNININRIYGTLEYRATENWLLNLGLMQEDHEYTGKTNSPRFSSNMQLNESQTLRFSVSRAYRAPLAFEKFANHSISFGPITDWAFLIEPGTQLNPEEITSCDLGYIHTRTGSPFTFDVRVFKEKLRHIITPYFWQGVPNDVNLVATSFANKSQADIKGLEASIEYQTYHWHTLLTYSYTDIDHRHTPDVVDGINTAYPYDKSAPRHKVSLMLGKKFQGGLSTTATYHYVDDQYWLGSENLQPEYDRLDLSLSIDFKLKGTPSKLGAVIENALTNNYLDFKDENTFNRRLYVMYSMEFY